jgi:hypothetical protein
MATPETKSKAENKLNRVKERVNDIVKKSIEIMDLRSYNIRHDLEYMRDEFMQNLNKSILFLKKFI